MVNHRQPVLVRLLLVFTQLILLSHNSFFTTKCLADTNWHSVDQFLANQVLLLNIGLSMKLANKYYVQVVDMSRKKQYYIFTTTTNNPGYQIVGRGSAFSVLADSGGKIFFVTNQHVLDNAYLIKNECEMFYAAAMLYADKFMSGQNKFERLLQTINLASKKARTPQENKLYILTVDAIWDCYDAYLSNSVDPERKLFSKYKNLVLITGEPKYFLHKTGSTNQNAIEVVLYKSAKTRDLDLAILQSCLSNSKMNKPTGIYKVKLGNGSVFPNQEIQIIGYPDSGSFAETKQYYPSFSEGRIIRVGQHMFEFEAALSKGFSGGPVVNKKGEAIGIVTMRLLSEQGAVSTNHGAAIRIEELKYLIPEIFVVSGKKISIVRNQ